MQNKVSTHISVDSHFHVFEAGHAVPEARYSPNYAAKADDWQNRAQQRGVTHGVLVQTSFMGTDNRYLVQHLQQSPDTLRGVAVIAPSASPQQLVDLHAQGVRGIRLNLAGQSHDMAPWQDAQTLWDTVLRLGWHVELHTDTGALPVVLAAVPAAVPVVIDHFGKPVRASVEDETVQAVQSRLAGDSPTQVYVKLSAAYRLQVGVSPTSLAQVWLGELGKKALLWGSDWPCTNFETKADYATLHDLLDDWLQNDKAVIQAVRTANPMGLYWGKH